MINEVPFFKKIKTASTNGRYFTSVNEGISILNEAIEEAQKKEYKKLIGPMDYGSWGAYRLVIFNAGGPSFAGEPQSGIYDLEAYLKAGFTIGEMYSSVRIDLKNITKPVKRVPTLEICAWDGKKPENLLKNVHRITMSAFADTPLFSPISEKQFTAAYLPLLEHADPRFLLNAFNTKGEMVAYLLSYPDAKWSDTVIVKSYATLLPGAGGSLMDQILWQGKNDGFKDAIIALIREGNTSESAFKRYGATIFRRYALMEKKI